MIRRSYASLREFYEAFTSGLTTSEMQRLWGPELKGMYSFYAKHVKEADPSDGKVLRFLKFAWYLFVAFLFKMTPGRRLLYAVAIAFVIVGLWQASLLYLLYAFGIVSLLLALELAERLITRGELEFAREIQLSLFPVTVDPIPGFSIATSTEVAQSVGGDYLDVLRLSDGSTMIVIGDVSGKGISAALYMVKVQTALQLFAQEHTDLKRIATLLNAYMADKLMRTFFLTLSLVRLTPRGRMEMVRAGHMPALFSEASRKAVSWLQPRGAAIGLSAGLGNGIGKTGPSFSQVLEVEKRTLKGGDTVILFTDGVVEATNQAGEEFGESRLMQVLSQSVGSAPEEIKGRILEATRVFRGDAALRDDTTFVVIRREPLRNAHIHPVHTASRGHHERPNTVTVH
jgi:phosphoserine phosphatase RsbU/P